MLLEREQALAELAQLANMAQSGHGTIALIEGEAGMGKTALLQEIKQRVGTQFRIFWGGCDALYTPRPLCPLYDFANAVSSHFQKQLLQATQSPLLFQALIQHLQQLQHPALMIIEDAHWADHASLDLLAFLGRRISLLPMVLLISYRNDELTENHPLKAVLDDLPSRQTQRITLQALSREAVGNMVNASAYDIDNLYDLTGGNPFYVTELLENQHRPGEKLPASIKEAMRFRIEKLSLAERQLLETLAVIPSTISLTLLVQLYPENGETLAMACVGRHLLVQANPDNLRFRHELSRLALLDSLSVSRVKKAHADILHALQTLQRACVINVTYDDLVHHAAGAFDVACLLEFAPKAAEAAAALGAHKEAAAHLERALRYVDNATPELAASLYDKWAYEAGLGWRIDEEVLEARRHAITIWRALGRNDKVGENLRLLSRLHWYRGESTEANHYADDAIRVLENIPPSRERAMAYSFRSQLHMLNDRMPEAIYWGQRALELAEKYQDKEVRLHALNNIGTAKVFSNDPAGIPELEESLNLALEGGHHEHAARLYTNFSEYAVEFRNFPLAERLLTEGTAFNNKHDLFAKSFSLLGCLALLRLDQGRFQDAKAISAGVLNTERATLLMRLPSLTVYAIVKLRCGETDALELLLEALKDARATDELQNILPVRLRLIEAAWLLDRPELAIENLKYFNQTPIENIHHWRIGEAAIWAQRMGFELKPEFYTNLPAPHQAEFCGEHQHAANLWLELGLPYSAALSLACTIDDKSKADAFTQAQSLLEKLEAYAALQKLRSVANEASINLKAMKPKRGPYGNSRNHPLGLTKREQQILALISEGAANKDIAKSIARSPRTVEFHISSIFTKLSVNNRMEAMLRAHNEPWILGELA